MGVFAGRAITRGTVAAAKAKDSNPTMLTVTDGKKTRKERRLLRCGEI
jgi:hypothetical protein